MPSPSASPFASPALAHTAHAISPWPSLAPSAPHPYLPTLSLSASIARSLRTLFFATTPPNPISYLLLHRPTTPSTLTIHLSPHPTALPLYHPPHPPSTSNTLLLSLFPLSATASTLGFQFSSSIPDVDISQGVERSLQNIPFLIERTPLHVLLCTAACNDKYGFVTRSSAYHRVISARNLSRHDVPVGVWVNTPKAAMGKALLHLAKLLHVRTNVKLASRTPRKAASRQETRVERSVVVIRYGIAGDVWVMDVKLRIGRLSRWVCMVPWEGGVGAFVKMHRQQRGRDTATRRTPGRSERTFAEVHSLTLQRADETRDVHREMERAVMVEESEMQDGDVSDDDDSYDGDTLAELLQAKMQELSFMTTPPLHANTTRASHSTTTTTNNNNNNSNDDDDEDEDKDEDETQSDTAKLLSLRLPVRVSSTRLPLLRDEAEGHTHQSNLSSLSVAACDAGVEKIMSVDLSDDFSDTLDEYSDIDDKTMDALCQKYLNTSYSQTVQTQLYKLGHKS